MDAMVPSPRHRRIQQLANMLCNKSMLLKLENIIVFAKYLLAIKWQDALSMRHAWVFVGCVSGQRWEYHTLSGRHWEFAALSGRRWEYDALRYSQRQRW
jgi:hypothetical protein